MRIHGIVAMATLSSSLLIVSLGAPAAAARTKVEIVNGNPDRRVDVCVNGREVASGLRYGRFVFTSTKKAKATVKFFRHDPRRCRGKLLGKRTSGLDDVTFVITRRKPQKVVVFDNASLAEPAPPNWSEASVRHAADLGAVQVATDFDVPEPNPVNPSADNWTKGSQGDHNLVGSGYTWGTFVTRGGTEVVRPHLLWVRGGERRYEWILVGTAIRNAELVFIDRKANPA